MGFDEIPQGEEQGVQELIPEETQKEEEPFLLKEMMNMQLEK